MTKEGPSTFKAALPHNGRLSGSKPIYPQRTPRPTKLDPFKDHLNKRVAAAKLHRIPASVLFRDIQVMGYSDGTSRHKKYLIQFKLYESDLEVLFETAPGQQLQVDFTTI